MMKRWLLAALLMLALVSGEARAQVIGGGGGCGVVSPCSPGQGGTGVNNGTNTLTLTGNNTVPSWVVNPPSNSYGKGINITQTGPLSGSITGPLDYNVINVTHESTVTGTGTSQADAFRVNMQTGGANLGGGGPIIGGYFNIIEGISGVTGAADKIGAVGSCDIIVSDSSGGGCYGLNSFAGVGASGAINRLVGVEADMSGTSGGAVSYRYAFSAVNEGTAVQGTTLDSAYFIGNIGGNGAAFENGFALSQSLGYAPLTTSANLFVADAAMTIANVLQFPNLTVTGDILNFPNVTLTGSGQLTATGLVISSNSITASQVTFQTPVTMNDLPATGGLSYVCQAAGGVLTAQSSC